MQANELLFFLQDSTSALKSLYFERYGQRLSGEEETSLAAILQEFFFKHTAPLHYEILDPVATTPEMTRGFDRQTTKVRNDILSEVKSLPPGCWLPVVFQTEEQAYRFAYNRVRQVDWVECKKRKQIVFLRGKIK